MQPRCQDPIPLQQQQQQPILNPQLKLEQPPPAPERLIYAGPSQGSYQFSQGVNAGFAQSQNMVLPIVNLQPQEQQQATGYEQQQNQPVADQQPNQNTRQLPTEITEDRLPVNFRCVQCGFVGYSRLEFKMGCHAYYMVFYFLICFAPFAYLPCCLDSYQDAWHYCPKCDVLVGKVDAVRHRDYEDD